MKMFSIFVITFLICTNIFAFEKEEFDYYQNKIHKMSNTQLLEQLYIIGDIDVNITFGKQEIQYWLNEFNTYNVMKYPIKNLADFMQYRFLIEDEVELCRTPDIQYRMKSILERIEQTIIKDSKGIRNIKSNKGESCED